MTGFNLPPGCTTQHIDDLVADSPCECCGEFPDDCFCPTCPKCGEIGNKFCYVDHEPATRKDAGYPHGMKFTARQLIGQTQQHIRDLKSQIADAESYIEWLTKDAEGRKHR